MFFCLILIFFNSYPNTDPELKDLNSKLDELKKQMKDFDDYIDNVLNKYPKINNMYNNSKKIYKERPNFMINSLLSKINDLKKQAKNKKELDNIDDFIKLLNNIKLNTKKKSSSNEKLNKNKYSKKYKTIQDVQNPFTDESIFDQISKRYQHRWYARLFDLKVK